MKTHLALVHAFAAAAVLTTAAQSDDPAEEIFREAVAEHRRARTTKESWRPWADLPAALRQVAVAGGRPLEAIGAYEESILFIERSVARSGEGEDSVRDAALSRLYCGYARSLSELDADRCTALALSPRTLLIGAETADRASPSTRLCRENAENSARNAATLDAANREAEELLADLLGTAAGEDGVHERKPREFVAELFDSFADTFDEKLLGSLGYRVPAMVGEAAGALRGGSGKYASALDAGCGTGLAGRHLRPLVSGPMIGVDASQKMLDIAAECTTASGCGIPKEEEVEGSDAEPLYDGLFALDLEDMTIANTLGAPGVTRNDAIAADDKFDLIVAADVLVYFGKLDSLLQTFAKVSAPNAGLIFSCERADEGEAPLGWRLLSSGRFAHTKAHAVQAAAKVEFELVSYEEMVPRMERGKEVRGHLFSFVLKGGETSGVDGEL